VPSRASHEAQVRRGPALVIVPMGDWAEQLDDDWQDPAAPDRLLHRVHVDPAAIDDLMAFIGGASAPVLVVGAGLDGAAGWEAVTALAERLACPVWQDTFSSRAGFPQDNARFAGHLPWQRSELRGTLAEHDMVLALGTLAFRLYLYDGGPLVAPGTRVAVVADDPDDVQRSRCELAVLAPPAAVCAALAARVSQRTGTVVAMQRPAALAPPAPGERLAAAHVLDALEARLPDDVVLVEEAPSARPELLARLPTRGAARLRCRRERDARLRRSGRDRAADGAARPPSRRVRRRRLDDVLGAGLVDGREVRRRGRVRRPRKWSLRRDGRARQPPRRCRRVALVRLTRTSRRSRPA
jgi:benzoylformate decarboxylase